VQCGAPQVDVGLSESFRIPHDHPPRWLFVLTAYLDESGQESTEYVFVAGFLGSDDQWKQLAQKWKDALEKRNRKALHMSDLRWSKPDRIRPLLESLGPIPYECGLEPVLGGVRVADYSDLTKGTIDELLMAGYISALYPLVIQALRWIPKNERLELVFEAQDRYEPFAHAMLSDIANQTHPELMTDDRRPKLANWRFVPKGSTVLTQPADYFAYALTQIYRDKKSEKSKLCSPIMRDGEKSKAIGWIFPREQVRRIMQILSGYGGVKVDKRRRSFT
jgi:hypothetical protein